MTVNITKGVILEGTLLLLLCKLIHYCPNKRSSPFSVSNLLSVAVVIIALYNLEGKVH